MRNSYSVRVHARIAHASARMASSSDRCPVSPVRAAITTWKPFPPSSCGIAPDPHVHSTILSPAKIVTKIGRIRSDKVSEALEQVVWIRNEIVTSISDILQDGTMTLEKKERGKFFFFNRFIVWMKPTRTLHNATIPRSMLFFFLFLFKIFKQLAECEFWCEFVFLF